MSKATKKGIRQASSSPAHDEKADGVAFQECPKIFLVDVDADAQKALTLAGFNCTAGSLGRLIQVPNEKKGDNHLCCLNHEIPENLHEYDIVVVDLKDREAIKYDPALHRQVRDNREPSQLFFDCEYPQGIFDPRPIGGVFLGRGIEEIQKKESIIVVFATGLESITYAPVELLPQGCFHRKAVSKDNYSFLPSITGTKKVGRETKVIPGLRLGDLLKKHNQEFRYGIVFRHPTHYEDHRPVNNSNFFPLVTNSAGEIVAYAEIDKSSILFVFPQLEDKATFLSELFLIYLPTVVPNLFPFNTQFAWRHDEIYRLPGEAQLLAEKQSLEQEYAEKIAAKEREIVENYQKYQFLHDLLTENDKELVKAIELYFRWLGFDDIVNCDETCPARNEEDLQVPLAEGLLVVEVKGLGGTSTDNDCSQVSKIRRRREIERNSHDVFALYIVNHQRYLPPENRAHPPFAEPQINDARNDDRGLLTTYTLFKLYFAIEAGFITKEDACKSLLDYGLVEFKPSDSVSVGRPVEIHHNGTVGIFLLQGVPVRQDEELVVYENGWCRKVKIVNLQDQGKNVIEASDGEIGIKFSDKITKGSEFWKQGIAQTQ